MNFDHTRVYRNTQELGVAVNDALAATLQKVQSLTGEARSEVLRQSYDYFEMLRAEREKLSAAELIQARNGALHAIGSSDREAVRHYASEAADSIDAQSGGVKIGNGIVSLEGGQSVTLWGERTSGGGYRHGLLDDPQPISRNQAFAQNAVAEAMFVISARRAGEALRGRAAVHGAISAFGLPENPISLEDVRRYLPKRLRAKVGAALAELGPQFRAFAPNAGEGAEVVLTTQTIPGLIRFRDLDDPLVQLFTAREMTMRGDRRVRLKSRLQMYRFGDLPSGATEASKLRASQVAFDTLDSSISPIGARALIDYYAEEDSLIDIFALLRSEAAIALARTIKDVIINGDTASTLDGADFTGAGQYGFTRTGVSNAEWHLAMADGLRKRGNATKIALGSDTGASGFRKLLASMDTAYASRASILISHRDLYVNVLAETKFESQETFGAAAVLMSGLPSMVYNTRIIPTDAMPTNLNASGIYDGSVTSKTVRIALDPSDLELNQKGQTVQAVIVDPTTMSMSYVIAARAGFTKLQPAVDAATNPTKSVVVGYNLPSSI